MKGPGRNFLRTEHVCPWWMAYTFDNPIRRMIHNPEEILREYVNPGQTAVDIGCGMGFFSLGLARLVGREGRVIAVDLQEQMLRTVERRARRSGLAGRIRLHRCQPESLGLSEPVDFALAFWMVHEVAARDGFFREIAVMLKPEGRFLMAEPRMHVGKEAFSESVARADAAGLEPETEVNIRLSRSVLFGRRLERKPL